MDDEEKVSRRPKPPAASPPPAAPAKAERVPTVGDAVLYWPPKRPGQPFVPYSLEARIAGVGDAVMLSVSGKQGRFRASVPREPRAAHPEGGWSWPNG